MTYLDFLYCVQLSFISGYTKYFHLCDIASDTRGHELFAGRFKAAVDKKINYNFVLEDYIEKKVVYLMSHPLYETLSGAWWQSDHVAYYKRLEILNELIKEEEYEELLRKCFNFNITRN